MAAPTLMGSSGYWGKARRAWRAPRAIPGRSEKGGTEMRENPIVTLFRLASVTLPVAAWLVVRWYSRAWPSPAAPCARSRWTV